MAVLPSRRLRLWQDRIETEILVAGAGRPLVYLHGPWGLRGDEDFLQRLARGHTVYAPRHPGTTPGDPDAAHRLDGVHDLALYYAELLDRLELERPIVMGHSFGGMVACELAAAAPARVEKLVLIDPVGLWRDDHPVKNWMIMPEEVRRRALFADPAGEAAQRFFGLPNEPEARNAALVGFIWAQACTGKFVWPIPDRGLKNRMHRIGAPSLVIWGKEDGIAAAAYAEEFARRLPKARAELVARAGHLPHLEQADEVARLVARHLSA